MGARARFYLSLIPRESKYLQLVLVLGGFLGLNPVICDFCPPVCELVLSVKDEGSRVETTTSLEGVTIRKECILSIEMLE